VYAILDIETTGGKYNEEGITEIAIYKFDGHEIVDQFASLVNPERPIQPFVANLTGINNDMLRQAPKFYEVAKRIIEITNGCIMVAHNALFDNRILTTEFDRLGYRFEKETLCTVELSKKLIPDMPSYSLGKLVRSLGIPLSDRHRAQGDAKATVALFKLLLAKDTSKEIISESLRQEQPPTLKPKLLEIIENIPSETGIYYMHNEAGNILYIGKNKNIKRRLIQHFTGENSKSKKMQREVKTVTFEKTGNELIALLKEAEELKQHKPPFNRGLRKTPFTHQLVSYTDSDGYINLKITEADGRKKSIMTFSNYQLAISSLLKIAEDYELCHHFLGITANIKVCPVCGFKCPSKSLKINIKEYNQRVEIFLKESSFQNHNMLIIDRGREIDERSVVWIENGKYKGYGYYNLNYQINNPKILKSIINPVQHSSHAQHTIQNYLRKNKGFKTVNLSSKGNK